VNKRQIIHDNHLSCRRTWKGIKWVWFECLGLGHGVMLWGWLIIIQYWFGFLGNHTPETRLGVAISVSLKALHSFIWRINYICVCLCAQWLWDKFWSLSQDFSHSHSQYIHTYFCEHIKWKVKLVRRVNLEFLIL